MCCGTGQCAKQQTPVQANPRVLHSMISGGVRWPGRFVHPIQHFCFRCCYSHLAEFSLSVKAEACMMVRDCCVVREGLVYMGQHFLIALIQVRPPPLLLLTHGYLCHHPYFPHCVDALNFFSLMPESMVKLQQVHVKATCLQITLSTRDHKVVLTRLALGSPKTSVTSNPEGLPSDTAFLKTWE